MDPDKEVLNGDPKMFTQRISINSSHSVNTRSYEVSVIKFAKYILRETEQYLFIFNTQLELFENKKKTNFFIVIIINITIIWKKNFFVYKDTFHFQGDKWTFLLALSAAVSTLGFAVPAGYSLAVLNTPVKVCINRRLPIIHYCSICIR